MDALADLLELHMPELVALCHQEAGKTIHDSIDEVREAVDFCRYYGKQVDVLGEFSVESFDGSTRRVSRQGRGVFVCISPWNFPLAIFLGQISAALVAGNTVIAKPAEQTSLIAYRAVELMQEAGFLLEPSNFCRDAVPISAAHSLLIRPSRVWRLLARPPRRSALTKR